MADHHDSSSESWLVEKLGGTTIRVLIQPRASKNEVLGLHGAPPRLRIRVTAPPIDGEANQALIAFLSKKLELSKSSFEIVFGERGKIKDVFCFGISADEIKEKLLRAP